MTHVFDKELASPIPIIIFAIFKGLAPIF
jgi:hypothetical protein